ncbi:hypothetical protein J5N97_000768 [Dioscorea zingiberensis]|uniref:Thioredoxin-like protein CITRX, chloroplastic n=1 Tax=Dioscorea zingiberensis TaxID=325984 RepID=A0A9D5BVB9_9LILI|nr:hypothetical protein J5N97_000768 [Dioscorea zingiberensis]
MAAAIHCSPSLASSFTTHCRILPSSLPLPRSPLLRLAGNRSRRRASVTISAKYIRDDYLVVRVWAPCILDFQAFLWFYSSFSLFCELCCRGVAEEGDCRREVEELFKGERTVPLIVDFYATWCGPCILMAQELEMLAVEYENNALFVKVDTDDEYDFARNMQVRGLPTLYFISPDPSKDAIRTEGLVPSEMIKNIIDNEL